MVGHHAAGAPRRHLGAHAAGSSARARSTAASRSPPVRNADEFTTETTYRVARTGEKVTRTGRAIVYTGFQWRGRSSTAARRFVDLREVMFVDRDWRTIEGRWFTGGYDEIGIDVKLERVGSETRGARHRSHGAEAGRVRRRS